MFALSNARYMTASDMNAFAGVEYGPHHECPRIRDVKVGMDDAVMIADANGVVIMLFDKQGEMFMEYRLDCTFWMAVFFIERCDGTIRMKELDALKFVVGYL